MEKHGKFYLCYVKKFNTTMLRHELSHTVQHRLSAVTNARHRLVNGP